MLDHRCSCRVDPGLPTKEYQLNRASIAWLIAVVLVIGGAVPFATGSANMIVTSSFIVGPEALAVVMLPFWSATFFAASFVLVFALVGERVGFAGITRPLLVVVTGAWALDAINFWNVEPHVRLVSSDSVGTMFRAAARGLRGYWSIGGSQIGWIMLVMVVALAVGLEIALSRRRAR